MRLVGAELLKVRTTSLWWIFAAVTVPLWGVSLMINWANQNILQGYDPDAGLLPDDQAAARLAAQQLDAATTLYTTGQFVGVLMVMLLGAIVVTNEFFHQTATTTFLVTPRRERVLVAKLGAGVLLGLGFWLLTTVLNLLAVPYVLNDIGVAPLLGEPAVWRAMGLNALAFGLWAVLGVGAGVLLRSQVAAVLILSISYLLGQLGANLVFLLLKAYFGEGIGRFEVLVPTSASQLMVGGVDLSGDPPRWAGAVVLIGYAVVTGVAGTLIMRRRDIN